MNCASLNKILGSVAVAAILTGTAWGQSTVISDNEGGTNENNLGAYWYVYDDANDGGTSTLTNATPIAGGEYDWAPTAGEGNTANGGTPGYGALINWQMGANEPTCGVACTYGQMVGIGTQLAPEGEVADISGATSITFWAKASAPMTIRVEVATAPVLNFAYHMTTFDITTDWAQYTIPLVEGLGVAQPSWNTEIVALDLTQVEKIQWQASMDEAGVTTTGSLWLDDVVLEGKKIAGPGECLTCVGTSGQAANTNGWTLSDFDTKPYNQNGMGLYWYCYNDAEGRALVNPVPGTDFSDIFGGVTIDELDPTKPILKVEGNGMDAGNAAFIDFQLGPKYDEAGTTIKPFVGIGTSLSDELGTIFYNADQFGATGIYFDYKTTGDVDKIRVEVKANQSFGSNAGIVHYVVLEGTNNEWKGATVKWSDLVLPKWEEVAALPPSAKALKTSELTKIQWAFQGSEGAEGSIAVDNVKMLDASEFSIDVITPMQVKRTAGMSVAQVGRQLQISMGSERITNASLVTMQGKVVAAKASTNAQSISLPTANIATGLYLLKVNAGSRTLTSPVTITR